MEQLIPFISEVGFPIVVTLYLLHRIEAKLDTVVYSIQVLPVRMRERLEPDPLVFTPPSPSAETVHEMNLKQ